MSDKDSSEDKRKPVKKPRSGVVSSEVRDPNEALEYWTKEKIDNAKPIPFGKPDVTKNDSRDDEKKDDEKDDS